jgi:tetratricopeptide (TPR) repeat protein
MALIVLAALAAYANSFRGPFVFDDLESIPGNPTLRSLTQAWRPPTDQGGISVAGRPILNVSLALNWAISGEKVWSYHAFNLAVHLLAGLTLFSLIRRTFALPRLQDKFGEAAAPLALAITLLWLLHPLQTEAVTYIIQRAESLMGLFFLLTLFGFVRALDSPRPGGWRTFSVLACLLGVATKEIAALAPLLVILYDRTFVSGSFREAWRRHRWQHVSLLATWLPLLGLLGSTGGNRGGTFNFADKSIWVGHALTQFEAVTRYIWLTFWPHPQVFDYGEIAPPALSQAVLWAVPVMMLAGATAVALWRWPMAGFLGAWVFAILAPTSALPATLQIIVEHRMYLPLAAIMALVVAGAYLLAGRRIIVVLLVLAVAEGGLTIRRNEVYRTDVALWKDTVAKRPDNARAHYNLGIILSNLPGQLDEAAAEYQAALRVNPNVPEVHYNLGLVWSRMPGRLTDAAAEYQAALRLRPDYADAHNNLGNAWMSMPGRLNDAIAQFQEALRLKPDYAEAHSNLGNAWTAQPDRLNDAIAHLQEALRLKPGLAEAHNNLGNAWMTMPGRLNDAVTEFQEALRLKPDNAEAHYNLGVVWMNQPDRLNDAAIQFQEAIRLRPDYVDAHNNLGITWSKTPGRLNDGIGQFQEVLRLQPDHAGAQNNLGNDLMLVPGRLNEAIAQFQETVRLQPDLAGAHFSLAAALLRIPGRRDEAQVHFDTFVQLWPDKEQARQLVAQAKAQVP